MENTWKKIEMSPTWEFQDEGIGATVQGVLTRVETEVGPNKSTLYTIEKEDGELISIWGSTVLDARLGNLAIGEEVLVKYLGMGKGQKGKKDYYNFEVFHRPVQMKSVVTEL